MRHLVSRGVDTELIDLAVCLLEPGERLALAGDDETLAMVMSGAVRAGVEGRALGVAGGRADVFDAPGHAVYAPPAAGVDLESGPKGATLALASAPVDGGLPGEARIIGPDDQRVNVVGEGNWSRTVRTVLGPDDVAARLLLGETINPSGNWSSYPPHKHDEQDPPHEVKLEEVYLFRVSPAHGFGIQLRYDGQGEEAFTVGDGDVAVIPSGYHPVVAAPGYELYYLWVMAGEGREMAPRLDPRHAWVQQSR
jgi:5-deoxy-glucuronate isomerase